MTLDAAYRFILLGEGTEVYDAAERLLQGVPTPEADVRIEIERARDALFRARLLLDPPGDD